MGGCVCGGGGGIHQPRYSGSVPDSSSAPAKVSLGKIQNPELPLLIKLESTISINITLAME